MKLSNTKMVVVKIPEFCIPQANCKEYILMAKKFWSEFQNKLIQEYGCTKFVFDNSYCCGQFTPTVQKINCYSDVLKETVSVEQYDSYVELTQDENESSNREEILNLWTKEKQNDEI